MAISTMKVGAKMGKGFRTDISCGHDFIIDQPKVSGGTGLGPNPLEVFLSTLPACICAIGRIIATQRQITLNGIEVEIEGDIDKAFLLGKTTEGRAGFVEIRAFVKIDADLSDAEKEQFLHDVTLRCPIADNMMNATLVKETIATEVLA